MHASVVVTSIAGLGLTDIVTIEAKKISSEEVPFHPGYKQHPCL